MRKYLAAARKHLVLVSYLAVVAALGIGAYRLETTTHETHYALCALRADLERRVEASEDFLRRKPKGIPGISRKDIERSLAGQKSTLLALSELSC